MIGAIIGDVIGSVYEFDNVRSKDIALFSEHTTFTDDTVLTIATAHSLLNNISFEESYRQYSRAYPDRGYGGMFQRWIRSDTMGPYESYGNGSAMRVSPVAYFAKSEADALKLARDTAMPTHNHPEGIKGAQATAMAVYLALNKKSLIYIKNYVTEAFSYDFNFTIDGIRETYEFDETCQETVPVALQAVFESTGFEDAIRNAISIGGDSDTIACIAGSFAEAVYGVPENLIELTLGYLPEEFLKVIKDFDNRIFMSRPQFFSSKSHQ